MKLPIPLSIPLVVTYGFAAAFTAGFAAAQAPPDGSADYKRGCAQCHDTGTDRAPNRDAFREMTPERVLNAMENGPMIAMAARYSAPARRAIAEYVTGKSFSQAFDTAPPAKAMCPPGADGDFAAAVSGPQWNGWGVNTLNTRFQEGASAGLSPEQLPRLKVKWAFGFPGDIQAYGHPTVVGKRLFVGSQGGKIYSLSAATGCVHWFFDAGAAVRAAISIGRIGTGATATYAAFFGDQSANAYALDAVTGKLIWKTKVDNYPVARITGSPVFYLPPGGSARLFVPVASGEELAASTPGYQCCRFRGNLVALDASTGKQVWRTYTIDPPKPTRKNKNGVQQWGPSGAPIWSSPAIDPQRKVLYATTGDNYSDPTTRTSDAFMAMDIDTGKILWTRQMTAKDAYTAACRMPDKANCPSVNGPDLDFASPPILVTLPNGRRALLSGQKSGVVHALDPDQQGEVLWSTRIGEGGTMGGVQWGSAVDRDNIYAALSDIGRITLAFASSTDADPKRGGGMYAIRIATGERVWYTPPPGCGDRKRCSPAQSAAVTAIPGVAFSGSVDGHLRAYSTADGKILWDFDSEQTYQTVNGVAARGGSIDGPGPVVVGGMLYVNSGYPTAGGMPGNVLLAFSVDGN